MGSLLVDFERVKAPGAGETGWVYGGYGKLDSMTGQYAGFIYDYNVIQK